MKTCHWFDHPSSMNCTLFLSILLPTNYSKETNYSYSLSSQQFNYPFILTKPYLNAEMTMNFDEEDFCLVCDCLLIIYCNCNQ